MYIGLPPLGLPARGGGFSPPSIANLALWLDASDSSTITLDGSNNVSQWSDKSGNTRHATQATAGSRPGYANDAVNSMPSVVYSLGKFLATPAFNVVSNPGYTVFTAHRMTTTDSRRLYSWNNHIRLVCASGLVIDYHPTIDATGRFFPLSSTYPDIENITEWRYTVQHNSSASNTRGYSYGKPGAVLSDSGTGVAFSSTSSTFTVGYSVPQSASFIGSMGEILVYTRQLTAGEQSNVLGYLARKWSI
jgi:hypothetical protein